MTVAGTPVRRGPRWTPPSLGFCLMVSTYALTLAFFAWGLTTPRLDRVWQLHHQLKTGDVYALTRADRQLLISSLARHPALAEALLPAGHIGIISAQRDGWIDTPEVSILRTPRATLTQRILLEIQTPPEHLPYRMTLQGPGWQRELEVRERGTLVFPLPPPAGQPELLTLKLEGTGLRADSSSIGVRVTFDPPDDSAGFSDEDEEEDRTAEEERAAEKEGAARADRAVREARPE
jgi:hypothetical protein